MTLKELLMTVTGYESVGLYNVDGGMVTECSEATFADVLTFADKNVKSFKTYVYDGTNSSRYVRICVYLDYYYDHP